VLYYRFENNTYAPILSDTRIYYFTKSNDVKPFPQDFRMISGLATTRNHSATQTSGVAISCNHGTQTKFLPNATSHPGGCTSISTGIYFPSCGLANGATVSDDHL